MCACYILYMQRAESTEGSTFSAFHYEKYYVYNIDCHRELVEFKLTVTCIILC